jgi:hypothetical protein
MTDYNPIDIILSRSCPISYEENGWEKHNIIINFSVICTVTAKWKSDCFVDDKYSHSIYDVKDISFTNELISS